MTLNEAKSLILSQFNLEPRLKQHQAAMVLLDALSLLERREPLVAELCRLWRSPDDNLSELECALEELERWRP